MSIKSLLQSSTGRTAFAVALILAIGVAVFTAWRSFSSDSAADASANRVYICTETGREFRVKLTATTSIPTLSPFTGRNTGYPAERCFWTADGQVKKAPTFVLLNLYTGQQGPTFCPDCGRLVVIHNPMAHAESSPPPTQTEFTSQHASRE